jgi:hypothetical protein
MAVGDRMEQTSGSTFRRHLAHRGDYEGRSIRALRSDARRGRFRPGHGRSRPGEPSTAAR